MHMLFPTYNWYGAHGQRYECKQRIGPLVAQAVEHLVCEQGENSRSEAA
jgi:hypothetical protein